MSLAVASSALLDRVHGRALNASLVYRRAQAELVDVLMEVESHRVFLLRGHASLFVYATGELGLSESTAYSMITVSRKIREVPALGERFRAGEITLAKARRVAAVLTAVNQEEWLPKACALSTRKLDHEIAKVRPERAVLEEVSYVGKNRVRLKVGMSEAQMLELRHAQDLLCQSRRRPVNLEETIGVVTSEYLRRHDPVERARRATARKGTPGAKGARTQTGARVRDAQVGVRSWSASVGKRVTPDANTRAYAGDSLSNAVEKLVTPDIRMQESRGESPSGAVEKLVTPDIRMRESRGESPSGAVEKLVTPDIRMRESRGESPSGAVEKLVALFPKGVAPNQADSRPTAHSRTPIPAAIQHAVNLRDQRRCVERLPDGKRCNERRWTDIHHIRLVSEGGEHTPGNLVTLCSAHHKLAHMRKS